MLSVTSSIARAKLVNRALKSSTVRFLPVRAFATGPPPSVPARTPYNIDPNTADKSPEEMRVHTRTNHESEFKLGKHRSNALELIEKVPIVEVEGEMAICDGGGGALGHPLEYISLKRPGEVERCKYCGLRFASKSWNH